MSQLAFLLDQRYCVGCQSCQTACQVKNTSPVGISLRQAISSEAVAKGPYISLSCNHCEMPNCFASCPLNAISKDPETGIVIIDQELCDGCGDCITACPYSIPIINPETNKANKCDFCKELIDEGELPECVRACPVKVLIFGDLDEFDRIGEKEAVGFTYEETKPAVRFIVS